MTRYELNGNPEQTQLLGKDKAAISQFAAANGVHVHLLECNVETENRNRRTSSRLPLRRFLEDAMEGARSKRPWRYRVLKFGGWSVYSGFARKVHISNSQKKRYPFTYYNTEAAVAFVSPSKKQVYFTLGDVNAERAAAGIVNEVVPGAGVLWDGNISRTETQRKHTLRAVTWFMLDAQERGDKQLVRSFGRACEREERKHPGTLDAVAENVNAYINNKCSNEVKAARWEFQEDTREMLTQQYADSNPDNGEDIDVDTRRAIAQTADSLEEEEFPAIQARVEGNVMSRYADLIDALSPVNTETESESESLAPAA